MIISIELSDEDWEFISEQLCMASDGYESSASELQDDLEFYDSQIENACTAERLDGYISTAVRNARERARPKFSEN